MCRPVLKLVDPARAATADQGLGGPPPSLELREVFRTHSAYVATLAFRLLGRDDEIDDMVQEVFLSALSGLRHVLLLSSGGGFTCAADDALSQYASAQDPWGVWRDQGATSCNVPPPSGATCDPATGDEPLTCLVEEGFQPGGDRNQNGQVFGAVDAITQLDRFGLAGVRVHARLANDLDRLIDCGPVCLDLNGFGISTADGRAIGNWRLGNMVQHGSGNFADPGTPTNMSVQDIECAPQTFPAP